MARLFYPLLSVAPQLGQFISLSSTTNPQFEQVFGWDLPNGAPHEMHAPSPTGFAVPQYSQAMRFNRSES